jgi:hypothetical protein
MGRDAPDTVLVLLQVEVVFTTRMCSSRNCFGVASDGNSATAAVPRVVSLEHRWPQ